MEWQQGRGWEKRRKIRCYLTNFAFPRGEGDPRPRCQVFVYVNFGHTYHLGDTVI